MSSGLHTCSSSPLIFALVEVMSMLVLSLSVVTASRSVDINLDISAWQGCSDVL